MSTGWSGFDVSQAEKEKLAAEFLRLPNDPLMAAIAVFGEKEIGKSSWAAMTLPTDIEVLSYQAKLLKQQGGLTDLLPTKEALAMKLWQWVQGSMEAKDKLTAAKLLAEMQDWLPKPGSAVQVNVTNHVMEVPTAPSADAWEDALAKQQRESKAEVLAVH